MYRHKTNRITAFCRLPAAFLLLVLLFYCSPGWATGLKPLYTAATNTTETGNAVAIDTANQWIYVTGRFTSHTAFPGINASDVNGGVSNGKRDGFLAKFNFTGTLLWVVNFGNDENDEGVDVAVGPDNNIYITGYAQRSPVFRSTSGATSVLNIANGDKEDIFLASYDPNGLLRWARKSGGNERDRGLGISVDATGVYSCGVYEKSSAQIGGINVNPTYDDANTYLWKTDFLGNTLWMIEAKSNSNDYDQGKSVQELKMGIHAYNGNVYVVGYMGGSSLRLTNTTGSLLSSPILNNADGQPDVFVYSASSTGTINWARNFSNNSNNIRGYSITADCEAVYVAGTIHNNASIPPITVSMGEHDFPFIASLNPANGLSNWVVALSGNTNHEDVIYDITADNRGYIYVTGTFRSNPFHGPDTTLAGAADNEVFISKYRRDGDFVWAQNTTNPGNSYGYGLAVYRNDMVFVTGEYSQNLNFGSVTTTSAFTQNLFLTAFNAGNHVYNSCCIVPSVGGMASVTPAEFCPGSDISLNLTGYTGNIQWQVSADGGSTWNSIAGAITASYNYTPASGNLQFRAEVTGVGCVPVNSTVATAQYETVNPMILGCPSNITVGNDLGLCTKTVSWTAPVVSDNCVGANLVQTAGLPAGSAFPKGTTSITYLATDAAGNTATCSFTVTVTDNENPVIAGCPASISVSTDPGMCTATVSWTNPTATDNCAGVTLVQTAGPPSGSAFPTGITNIVYTATDAEGNSSTCSFNVAVTDEELPVFGSCPGNIVISSDPGVCSANVSWTNPLSFDNCSITLSVQTAGLPNGSAFPLGTTLVSYTATDASGNASTCSFNVTVTDNEAPEIITCPVDITSCDSLVSYSDITGTDNCSVLSIVQTDGTGYTSGSVFPVGITSQQYTLTDLAGNVSTCSFNVHVLPVIQPQFSNVPDSFCRFAPAFDLLPTIDLHPGETSFFYGSAGVHIDGLSLFMPALSDTGLHQIYHVVNNGTCSDTGVVEVRVLRAFESTWSVSDTLCAASGILWLDSLLEPWADHGGIWMVNGSIALLNPNLADHAGNNIELTYLVGPGVCSDTTTYTCWVAPLADPTWNFESDTICSATGPVNLPALVTGTPGGTWWGNGVMGTQFYPDTLSGSQNIVYTAGVPGCTQSSSHDLYIYAQPVIDAGSSQEICGRSVELQGIANTGNITWTGATGLGIADPANLNTTVTVDTQGIYRVYLEVMNGLCMAHDSVELVFSEPPVAHAGDDQQLDFIHTTNLAAGAPEYGVGQWTAVSENIVFADASNRFTQVYNLVPGTNVFFWTVTNGSCPQVRDDVVVYVKELFIPSGFSPNGDGTNDFFEIRNIGEYDNRLQVFNRWGQVVYEASQYNNTWNGTNGANDPLPDDTYYYVLEIKNMGAFTGYVIIKKQ